MKRDDLLTPAMRKLRDRLLKAAKFVDIECDNPDQWLKNSGHNLEGDAAQAGVYASAADYYHRASEFLHTLPPRSLEYDVWALFCDGMSYTQIAKQLHVERSRCYRVARDLQQRCFAPKVSRITKPRKPDGYSRDCYQLNVKLNQRQMEALFSIAEQRKITKRNAIRLAILMAEKDCGPTR